MQVPVIFTWIVLLLILVPGIFYLLTLQKTLSVISPLSRMMSPQQVWLLLIPLFNIVWHFIMVSRLSDSIKNECARLHIPLKEEKPAYSLGIGIMCLYLVAVVINSSGIAPVIGSLLVLASFTGWIVYWVKINSYKNLITANHDNFLLDVEREAANIND
ncbi:MAG: hypothetical protein KF862_17900 [Chitinophagaceae bacterium]|nr:hypothetical protein [Chitinophagaceae bacterium]